MRLFLTIEAQNAVENGLADILQEVNNQLSFITEKNAGLEDIDNYGTEFRIVSVIPTCVDDSFWNTLGWQERTKVWRKKKEADVRLRIDYDNFRGDELISDILKALNVQQLSM